MASKKTEGSDVMRVFQGGFSVSTRTRETREITSNVQDVVSESGFQTGIVHGIKKKKNEKKNLIASSLSSKSLVFRVRKQN